ncbi:MAG: hypothetical protein AB1505_20895 [Candidatus Latescibacterota bacterium]
MSARPPLSWTPLLSRAGRRARTRLLGGLCRQRVVFHHVPRYGGTSAGKAMPLGYLLSRATIDAVAAFRAVQATWPGLSFPELLRHDYALRQQLFLYLLARDYRFVWAHVEFSETAHRLFGGRYRFVTLLRDPVERYLSNYYYDFGSPSPFAIREPLEEFVESERGAQLGRRFCQFYSGLPPDRAADTALAVRLAQQNLHRFAVVGFLHDTPGFVEQLGQLVGSRLRMGHTNRGRRPASGPQQEVSPPTRERIRVLCQPDVEVYEYALKHFGSRPAGHPAPAQEAA